MSNLRGNEQHHQSIELDLDDGSFDTAATKNK